MGILFYLSIFGYAIFYKLVLPELKIGASLFCSFLTMLAASYFIIIIMGIYIIGAYIIILGGLIVLALSCLYIIFKKKKIIKSIFTPSLFVFLSFITVCILLLNGVEFKHHDAYSFWGRAVREMYEFNTSYFNADSNIGHIDYNPAFPSLEYSVVRVFGWKNEYLFYCIAGCIGVVLSSLTDKFTWKKIKYPILFVIFFVFTYSYLYNTYSINFLGLDGPMCLIFICGLLMWYNRYDNNLASILPIILCIITLPMLKLYSGLMFATILFALMIIEFAKKYIAKKEDTLKNSPLKTKYIIITLILLLLSQFSWSAYYNYNIDLKDYNDSILKSQYMGEDFQSQEKPDFSIKYLFNGNPRNDEIKSGFSAQQLSQALDTVKKTLSEFATYKIQDSELTVFTSLMLIILGILLTFRISNDELKRKIKSTCISLIIASLLYTIGTFIALIVQPGIASGMIRYFGVVWIPFAITLFYYCINVASEHTWSAHKTAFNYIVIIFIILIMNTSVLSIFYSNVSKKMYEPAIHAKEILSELSYNKNTSDRMLIVDNIKYEGDLSVSGVQYCYQYFALPSRLNALYIPYDDYTYANKLTKEYFTSILKDNRINKIIVITDNEKYREIFSEILGISKNTPQPWIVTVEVINKKFIYNLSDV